MYLRTAVIVSAHNFVRFPALALLVLVSVNGLSSDLQQDAMPPLQFVTEYARELVSLEDVRARGEAELNDSTDSIGKLASGIHFSTLMQLELRAQVQMLKSMRLTEKFASVVPSIITCDEQKVDLYQKIIDLVTEILGDPKPGIDYGKIVAEMPKLRAEIEDIDHTIFADITPMVCMNLLDMRPDSKNHISHLVITRAEKAELIRRLLSGFGSGFDKDQKRKNFTVSAGLVMKGFLEGHRCSDDLWE